MVCKQSSTPLICCHLFIGVKIRQSAEKKKGASPFSIALFHNLIFIDTGNQCKSGFFEVNQAGGVYEAHGEDFSFESFCLPVHSAGPVFEGVGFVRFSRNYRISINPLFYEIESLCLYHRKRWYK